MQAEGTEKGERVLCLVIGSELLHSESTDVFIVGEADKRLLMRSPYLVGLGDKERLWWTCPVISLGRSTPNPRTDS